VKLFVGGARGTGPWTHPSAIEFGGDSSSYLVTGEQGEQIVIDAGSGLENITPRLGRSFLLAFTHYHMDHLCGLPAAPFLYQPDVAVTIMGPDVDAGSVEQVMSRWVNPPWWPVPWHVVSAGKKFCKTPGPGESMAWGGLYIQACAVPHEGGCVAYRIDEPARGSSLVIATDMEWGIAHTQQKSDFLTMCRSPGPVDAMAFDAQYLPSEYPRFKGWGHSTWQDAVDIHAQCGVERILVTHHGRHTDAVLREREKEAQSDMPMMEYARQGMEWTI